MECLTEIFRKPYAYVGMMGSKKRAAIVKKDLEESGFSRENISGLHSPIGLAIGGQTPEEIALSVISEIVKCKMSVPAAHRWIRKCLMHLLRQLSRKQIHRHQMRSTYCVPS